MTIWILALVLLASSIALGHKMGAVRAAFSFAGIVLAALLAVPVGKLLKPLFPHVGIHDPILIWLIAPVVAFALVLVLFKSAGFAVHRKVNVYFKYKAGDLRLALWERLNSRVGACVGALNGSVYLILICFLIFNFTYWTIQMASDDDPKLIKWVNRMGNDLQDTGAISIARAIDGMPLIYFQSADLAGLLYQNPSLADRLANYPAFLSIAERDEFKQLGQNNDFQNGWKNHAPIGALLKNPSAKSIWQNIELRNQVFEIVRTNWDDLTNYLQTGQSSKYDSEKILGRWDFNVSVTVAMLGQSRPNIPASEMRAARAWMSQAYANTAFVAGGDGQAFLKNLPQLKIHPGQPPTTETALDRHMDRQWHELRLVTFQQR